MKRIKLSTFFVRESSRSKKERKSVNINTRNSIKDSKSQSVAECDCSLNLWLMFSVLSRESETDDSQLVKNLPEHRIVRLDVNTTGLRTV